MINTNDTVKLPKVYAFCIIMERELSTYVSKDTTRAERKTIQY